MNSTVIGMCWLWLMSAPKYSEVIKLVRFELFMAVMILMMMFYWVKAPCGLVGRSQCFREACCPHLHG
jgi:hypothetical protein